MGMQVIQLFLACAAVSAALGGGCPSSRESMDTTLTQRVYHSDTVFYGRVQKKSPDPSSGSRLEDIIARTQVLCYLKGPALRPVIYVLGLGHIRPGRCNDLDVEDGQEYIMFGQSGQNGSIMIHDDMATVPATRENMALVTAACDLKVKYPQDVDFSKPQHPPMTRAGYDTLVTPTCPETADPATCVPEEHLTIGIAQRKQRSADGQDHDEDDPGHDHDHDQDGDHDHDDHEHEHNDAPGHDHDHDGDHDHDDHHVDHDGHDHDDDGDHDHDDHDHDHSDHGDDHDHDHDGDHDEDDHHVDHDDHDHDHDHDHDDESTKSPNAGSSLSVSGLGLIWVLALYLGATMSRSFTA